MRTSLDLNAKLIIVCTETGNSVRLLAKYRPHARILVLTATHETARYCSGLLRGVSRVVCVRTLTLCAQCVSCLFMCVPSLCDRWGQWWALKLY